MLSHIFLPNPALREYVKCNQLRHFAFSAGISLVEYVEGHTMVQRPRSMLMGQSGERTNRHLSGADFIVFIVEFQPGILYRIIGIPFDEFTNTFADAEAVFPKEIRSVW